MCVCMCVSFHVLTCVCTVHGLYVYLYMHLGLLTVCMRGGWCVVVCERWSVNVRVTLAMKSVQLCETRGDGSPSCTRSPRWAGGSTEVLNRTISLWLGVAARNAPNLSAQTVVKSIPKPAGLLDVASESRPKTPATDSLTNRLKGLGRRASYCGLCLSVLSSILYSVYAPFTTSILMSSMYVCMYVCSMVPFFVLFIFSVPTLVMFLLCAKELHFTVCAWPSGSHNVRKICPRAKTVTKDPNLWLCFREIKGKRKLQCFSRKPTQRYKRDVVHWFLLSITCVSFQR